MFTSQGWLDGKHIPLGKPFPNCLVSEYSTFVLFWQIASAVVSPLVLGRGRGKPVDTSSFLVGFALGFSLAVFLGFTARRILLAGDQSQSFRNPQALSTDTEETPLQVLRESIAAGLRCGCWALILVVGVGGFVWVISLLLE